MKTTKEKIEDIERIIYWLRRYGGIRNEANGKVWVASDMDILEKRIKAYLKRPSKFDFNKPEMGIESW